MLDLGTEALDGALGGQHIGHGRRGGGVSVVSRLDQPVKFLLLLIKVRGVVALVVHLVIFLPGAVVLFPLISGNLWLMSGSFGRGGRLRLRGWWRGGGIVR